VSPILIVSFCQAPKEPLWCARPRKAQSIKRPLCRPKAWGVRLSAIVVLLILLLQMI